MGPSRTTSSKGKNVEKNRESSEWSWHEKGGYFSRTNASGQLEHSYPPSTSQQEETPRSSRDNVSLNNTSNSSASLSSVAPHVEDNYYSTVRQPRDDYSSSASTRDYQTSSSNSDNYTVASPAGQATSSGGVAVTFSPQLTSSVSKSSASGNYNAYGSSSGSSQYQYASQSNNYGNRSYESSYYSQGDGLSTALNDMSLSSASAVPEEGVSWYGLSISKLTFHQNIPMHHKT
jgi:hypothetical protein